MMKDEIRAQVAGLDAGERQFLANHLWKHYKVAPQVLKEYLPKELFEVNLLEEGTFVKVTHSMTQYNCSKVGDIGVIVEVDSKDIVMPYRVDFGDSGPFWCPGSQIKKFVV